MIEDGGSHEVWLLAAETLELDGPMLLGDHRPVAFGFSDDGQYTVCFTLQAPEENGPLMCVGAFHFRDGTTFGTHAWNVDPDALAHDAPEAPPQLGQVYFDGSEAVVVLPDWGEVRMNLVM